LKIKVILGSLDFLKKKVVTLALWFSGPKSHITRCFNPFLQAVFNDTEEFVLSIDEPSNEVCAASCVF